MEMCDTRNALTHYFIYKYAYIPIFIYVYIFYILVVNRRRALAGLSKDLLESAWSAFSDRYVPLCRQCAWTMQSEMKLSNRNAYADSSAYHERNLCVPNIPRTITQLHTDILGNQPGVFAAQFR